MKKRNKGMQGGTGKRKSYVESDGSFDSDGSEEGSDSSADSSDSGPVLQKGKKGAKPAAKPKAKPKTVPKPVAAKPVAKPSSAKPTAKPSAKPIAARPALKPAANLKQAEPAPAVVSPAEPTPLAPTPATRRPALTKAFKFKVGLFDIEQMEEAQTLFGRLPSLSDENAVGRLVYVPQSVYPDYGGEGWVAKLTKVFRNGKKLLCTIKFHDATSHFEFEKAIELFRPLS